MQEDASVYATITWARHSPSGAGTGSGSESTVLIFLLPALPWARHLVERNDVRAVKFDNGRRNRHRHRQPLPTISCRHPDFQPTAQCCASHLVRLEVAFLTQPTSYSAQSPYEAEHQPAQAIRVYSASESESRWP